MAKIRFKITKGEPIRYISHLDYARAVERAIRRAQLPAAYSEGFNPHMKLAFASALAVGITSEAEYMDLELLHPVLPHVVVDMLKDELPPGIRVLDARKIDERAPKLMAIVNQGTYVVELPCHALRTAELFCEKVRAFCDLPELIYERQTPKGNRTISIKQFIDEITAGERDGIVTVHMAIKITSAGSVKPLEVIQALCQNDIEIDVKKALVTRTGLYIIKDNIRLTPLEAGEEKAWLKK